MLKIRGGNDLLPKGLADKLGSRIIYGARVVSMRQTSGSTETSYEIGGRRERMRADFIVCALPFTTLAQVQIEPAVSAQKSQLIHELKYAPVTKVALQTTSRDAWEKHQLSGFGSTDQRSEFWQPSWDQPGREGLLVLYQEGQRALELDRLTEPERITSAGQQAAVLFPGVKIDAAHSASYSWQNDPWARGAYSILLPGQVSRLTPLLSRPEGRIYFAGEHVSTEPGWIEGAAATGFRSAKEINQRA